MFLMDKTFYILSILNFTTFQTLTVYITNILYRLKIFIKYVHNYNNILTTIVKNYEIGILEIYTFQIWNVTHFFCVSLCFSI